KPFVKYFLHTGPLTVGSVKMSRSLGNYIEVKDLLEKVNPLVLRYFFASVHYRSPVDFSEAAINSAKGALEKIQNFTDELMEKTSDSALFRARIRKGEAKNEDNKKISKIITRAGKDFQKEMDDDFNAPRALAVIFDFIKNIRKLQADGMEISGSAVAKILEFLEKFNDVFGILKFEKPKIIPPRILKLADERAKARAEGKWAAADELRKKIEAAGYKIEDTPEGAKIKQK
ncbi:MAG: DALR domain-containing protein, partial [Patescibacteria group bacterium]